MRIGINCRTILNPGFGEGAGVGHYTFYLVKNLLRFDQANDYYLYFDELITKEAIDEVTLGAPNAHVRRFPFHQYKKMMPFAYSHILVTGFVGRDRLDVYHAPSGIVPYTYKEPSVITIHDLAIYKHPEWFPEGRISKAVSTKMLVPKSVDQASKIIAVSESTKKDLMELFSVNPQKIEVVYEGVELPGAVDKEGYCKLSQPVKKKYNIENDYFFSLGTLEPRKNFIDVLEAMKLILEEEPELLRNKSYLIAGVKGWRYQQIFEKIDEVNALAKVKIGSEPVRYIGYIPHADKFPLMACSLFFAFPSLYEGFGLPVLEAMRMGVPVITSNISSIPEITGDAALLIDPKNAEQMKKAITKILKNPSIGEELGGKGKKRALNFTWEKAAQQTVAIYKTFK